MLVKLDFIEKIYFINEAVIAQTQLPIAHATKTSKSPYMANLLTIARMLAVIPFTCIFLLDAPWNMNVALAIFVIASLTDFLDGWIARRRGEESALGAALDPLADKLLLAAALILLVRNGIIQNSGVIAVLIIILREILVSGLREAVGGRGGSLPVSFLAKIKTTVQLVAAGCLIAAAPNGLIGEMLRPVAMGLLWTAAALTFWTGSEYTRRAVEILRRSQS